MDKPRLTSTAGSIYCPPSLRGVCGPPYNTWHPMGARHLSLDRYLPQLAYLSWPGIVRLVAVPQTDCSSMRQLIRRELASRSTDGPIGGFNSGS